MAVRRERVILDLQDNFSSGMVRAAGATSLLHRNLRDLDGTSIRITQTFNDNTQGVDQFRRTMDQSGPSIDRFSGRLAALAQAGIALGPGLIPIGAVAVPAVTGLASQLGFAAIGMGSLVVATRGLGDALKAVNAASIEPTAANLEKARAAMADLGPEARALVDRLHELGPVFDDIRDASAAGWFPGLTEALDDFARLGPRVANLFEAIGEAGGRLVADGVAALTGPQWFQFLDFVQTEGPEALDQLGRSIGNVVHGMAELWMAFDPLNDDFSNWMLEASRGFDDWAEGLSQTEGFQDFIEYIRDAGPQVERTLGSIAEATIAIIKAASPLGGPVLAAFEVVADTLKTIADSPFGTKIFTMAAAFVVLNKTLAVTAGLLARTGFISAATAGRMTGAGTGAGPGPVGGGPAGGPSPVPILGRVSAARTGFAQFRTDLRDLRNATLAQRNASTALIAAQARVNATMKSTAATTAKGALGVGAFAVATGALGDGIGLQNTAMLGLAGSIIGPWGAAIGAGIGLMADMRRASAGVTDEIKALQNGLGRTAESLPSDLASISASWGRFNDRMKENESSGTLDALGDAFDLNNPQSLFGWISGAEGKQREWNDELVKSYDYITGIAIGIEQYSNRSGMGGLSFWDDSKADIIAGDFAALGDNAAEVQRRMEELAPVLDYLGLSWQDFAEIAGSTKFDNLVNTTAAKAALGDVGAQAAMAAVGVASLRKELANFGFVATKQSQWRDYQAAIDDFTKSVKENGRTLDEDTAKGRANAQALSDIATTAAAFAQSLTEAERPEFLKKARAAFIDAAKKAGGLDKQARDLLATLDDLIGEYPVEISAETREARAEIQRIKDLVAGIKDKNVRVNVFTNYLRGVALGEGGRDGDPSTPYASGGFTGWGRKYEPAGVVHRGEVVIPQELVARDRGLLMARYGHLRGMEELASGGFAGYTKAEAAARSRAAYSSAAQRTRSSMSGTSATLSVTAELSRADLDYLADKLQQSRPIYGDVHVQPHDYNDFRREQDADRRRAAVGGY